MTDRAISADAERGEADLAGVIAAVLTFRRPRLATEVVRGLVDTEGFRPDQVLLVINGDGGLEDPALERSIRTVRLPENVGPAGGFGAALLAAFADPAIRWVYLCEDDVGLFELPSPRVARAVREAEAVERVEPGRPVGAVVAYALDLNRRTGRATTHRVLAGAAGFIDVDAAAWGATLVARRVVDAGILPDEGYFIDYEDFDFFYRMQGAGFRLLLDERTAASMQTSSVERERAFQGQRPTDAQEPWRAYYVARNFFFLNRTHGKPMWLAWHLAKTVRRMQLARSAAARRAALRGVWDGVRSRKGKNASFERTTGELSSDNSG